MRFVSALAVLALLVSVGAAMASPFHTEEKPWSYTPFDVRAIIPENDSENNSCPGSQMACGDEINPAALNVPGDQDWFQFYVATAGTEVTIATDAINGSTTDTYLELYGACGGAILAQDDDSGPGYFSLIQNFPVPSAGTYYIKVRGYSSSTVGEYKMNLTCQQGNPPPENDTCAGAIVLERCTSGVLSGDLNPAVNNYDPGIPGPSCTGYSAAGKDLVWKFTLQAGDIVHLVYNSPNYDSSMYIVTDCNNVSGSCVVGEDDPEPETINWTCPAAGTYYLVLDAYGTNTGSTFTCNYNLECVQTPTGACCIGQVCSITTRDECVAQNGTYQGDNTDCDPNPCVQIPVETRSWGKIKSDYR